MDSTLLLETVDKDVASDVGLYKLFISVVCTEPTFLVLVVENVLTSHLFCEWEQQKVLKEASCARSTISRFNLVFDVFLLFFSSKNSPHPAEN
jgi:hypothetical protein